MQELREKNVIFSSNNLQVNQSKHGKTLNHSLSKYLPSNFVKKNEIVNGVTECLIINASQLFIFGLEIYLCYKDCDRLPFRMKVFENGSLGDLEEGT